MSILRKGWDIIFAFVFQIFIFKVVLIRMKYLNMRQLFFQELPNRWSISGAILVALAIFLNGAKKIFFNGPEENSPKNSLTEETSLKSKYELSSVKSS